MLRAARAWRATPRLIGRGLRASIAGSVKCWLRCCLTKRTHRTGQRIGSPLRLTRSLRGGDAGSPPAREPAAMEMQNEANAGFYRARLGPVVDCADLSSRGGFADTRAAG